MPLLLVRNKVFVLVSDEVGMEPTHFDTCYLHHHVYFEFEDFGWFRRSNTTQFQHCIWRRRLLADEDSVTEYIEIRPYHARRGRLRFRNTKQAAENTPISSASSAIADLDRAVSIGPRTHVSASQIWVTSRKRLRVLSWNLTNRCLFLAVFMGKRLPRICFTLKFVSESLSSLRRLRAQNTYGVFLDSTTLHNIVAPEACGCAKLAPLCTMAFRPRVSDGLSIISCL
jgi:hypothetical protein